MGYRVGDKVRVKEDLVAPMYYGEMRFVRDMEKYRGKVCIIKEVLGDGTYYLHGCVNEGARYALQPYWYWTDEMLSPYDVAFITRRINGLLKKGDMVRQDCRDQYIRLLSTAKSIVEEQ